MSELTNNGKLRVFLIGVGGQGSLTATALLARTALHAGVDVVAGEVHGMAQRGGVVESVLLLGGWRSPKLEFGEADIILGFEPLETLRGLPYLRKGGVVFSSSDAMPPVSVALGAQAYPSLDEIRARVDEVAGESHFLASRELGIKAGAVQAGNTVLLAALCASGLLPFGLDAFEDALRRFMPARILEPNLKALEYGRAHFA